MKGMNFCFQCCFDFADHMMDLIKAFNIKQFESTGSNSILLYFNPIKILKNEQVQKKPPSSIAVSLKQKRSTYLFFNASRSATAVSNCARIGFNNACLRLKLALFTIKREDTLQISSKGSKPLARKVFPVSTTSTI
jgi:hypothetical protein